MMTPDPRTERIDRVADRLAAALDHALTSLNGLRRSHPLTQAESTVALAALLEAEGIRLNEGLLSDLVSDLQ